MTTPIPQPVLREIIEYANQAEHIRSLEQRVRYLEERVHDLITLLDRVSGALEITRLRGPLSSINNNTTYWSFYTDGI
jgi:hypothetical protein